MDYRECSEELCQLYIDYAGVMNQTMDSVSAQGETGLLLWLSRRGQAAYPMDIARHFRISSGRVANILRKLEEKELVERRQDKEDLRRISISVTLAGREFAERYYAQKREEHEKILRLLSEKDAQNLLRMIRQILSVTAS